MVSDTKAIKKLKKKYGKWPPRIGFWKSRSKILNYLPASVVVWGLKKFLIKSDYRLKRESIKFFELFIRAYHAKKTRKTDRLLVIALNLLGLARSNSFSVLLRNAVKSTLDNSKSRGAISDSVLHATKNLEKTLFDATGWYQLSRGLFLLGYFRAAWVSRENSIDLSISESRLPGASATTLQRGIEAHLERRELLDADVVIKRSTSIISEEIVLWCSEYVAMMQGKGNKYSVAKLADQDTLKVFASLVSEKYIALVGSGSPSGDYGSEIDSADTVIRVKFVGFENLHVFNYHGSRCDVSHYNDLRPLLEISESKVGKNFFDILKLILSNDRNITMLGEVRVFNPKFEIPMYRTTATSGIRCLKLLILGKPASLKIYGFDFYLKKEQYEQNLLSFYKTNGWMLGHPNFNVAIPEQVRRKLSVITSFGAHDPVSNFCFAQNLYRAGLFDIEPYGKSILELTPYQYVERLEEMLGDW